MSAPDRERIAALISDAATPDGGSAGFSRVGHSTVLLHLADHAGRRGIVRIGDFPLSALRPELRRLHTTTGWRDPARIGDVPASVYHESDGRALRDLVGAALAWFGAAPPDRDRVLTAMSRSARHRAAARTRIARASALERIIATRVRR